MICSSQSHESALSEDQIMSLPCLKPSNAFPLLFTQYLNSSDIAYKTFKELALLMSLISMGNHFSLKPAKLVPLRSLYQLFCRLGMLFP